MNHYLKRIAAMMMALMLMLTGLSALAQAPAATEAEVFARGGRIKTETNIDVNSETLNGILAMFTGMPSQEGQDAQTAIINTVLGALRKLTASVVTDGKAAYVSVGSETGELFNFFASMGAEDSFALTNLLPGIELSLPANLIPSFTPQLEDAQNLLGGLSAYAEVAMTFVNEELLAKSSLEEGSFALEGSGTFDSKVSLELRSHQVADMLDGMLKVFKEDKPMQEQMDTALKSGAVNAQAMGQPVPSSQEMIKELEKGVAGMKEAADQKLANLTLYTANESEAMHMEAEILANETPAALLSVAVVPGVSGEDMHFSLLMPDTTAQTEGPVDWAATRQGVLGGTQPYATLFDAAFSQNTDEAANREEMKGTIDLYVMGITIGMVIDSGANISGEYASDGSFILSALGAGPLLTVTSKGYESTEEFAAPSREGLKKIALSEEMSEESGNEIMAALQTALPQLLERLVTVLPEEGPMMLTILGSM
ncbi:MAG: hypothetical protein GX674_05330, partial [Clostridiales bacterium]|nr:hypothetical protein [Clostridiales bacterium]